MGYTHYWYRPENLDREKFTAFKQDVQILAQALPAGRSNIKGGLGDGQPNYTSDGIWFNGDASVGANHETFHIRRNALGSRAIRDDDGVVFGFCKTAHKPYDLLVCMVLIAFKHHFGGKVKVSSDGDMKGTEWQEARELYEQTLGHKVPRQFKTQKS